MKEQKKESKSFWKKLGFVALAISAVALGAVAEKKLDVVDKTVDLTKKGANAVKDVIGKVFTKKPAVSNVNVEAPANNNYQGNGNYSRKYNN